MYLIPVGDNYTAVDKDIYDRWGSEYFCLDYSGYPTKKISRGLTRLHLIVLDVPKGMVADHKNRNKLDNRRSNLRACTPRQNNLNKPPIKGKYKGVFKHTQYDKWCAQFCGTHLGVFSTEEAAGESYNEACKQDPDYDFCFLNFIPYKDTQGFTPKGSDKVSTPFKGVSKTKGVTKLGAGWIARATKNGKRVYLGYHSSEEKACKAINDFRQE